MAVHNNLVCTNTEKMAAFKCARATYSNFICKSSNVKGSISTFISGSPSNNENNTANNDEDKTNNIV